MAPHRVDSVAHRSILLSFAGAWLERAPESKPIANRATHLRQFASCSQRLGGTRLEFVAERVTLKVEAAGTSRSQCVRREDSSG
jgi:hypothetical protein